MVTKALFDAQSILAATADDTPAAVTVAEQTVIGRITGGNIDDLTPAQVRTLLTVPKFASEVHSLKGVIVDPGAYYSGIGVVVPIWEATDAAITIQSIRISLDATTNELALDLKWADALIGLANAAVIDVCDTTSGVRVITTGFDDATVAAGKCLYWSLDATPHADINWMSWQITYTYD